MLPPVLQVGCVKVVFGAKGTVSTFIETIPDCDLLQPKEFPLVTLTKLKLNIPEVVVATFKVTLSEGLTVLILFNTPFSVYVKVYGATPLEPVKVTSGSVVFLHTEATLAVIVAVGKSVTDIMISFEFDGVAQGAGFVIFTWIRSLSTNAQDV